MEEIEQHTRRGGKVISQIWRLLKKVGLRISRKQHKFRAATKKGRQPSLGPAIPPENKGFWGERNLSTTVRENRTECPFTIM